MASRDHEHRRHRGQEQYGDRQSTQGENWGSGPMGGPRGQHNYQERAYSQQSQSDFDSYGGHARGNDFGSDYGSSRYGGPGTSTYGGYGGGQNYQDDRTGWGRQPQGQGQGKGQSYGQGQGYGQGYGSGGQRYQEDPFSGGRQHQAFDQGSGARQSGGYGAGDHYGQQSSGDRYGGGFYGDASRFSRGAMREETSQSRDGWGDSRAHGREHDSDYQQWRSEQLRNLDADYESWRAERYKKFSDEFNTWRSGRSQGGNQEQQQGGSGTSASSGISGTGSSDSKGQEQS